MTRSFVLAAALAAALAMAAGAVLGAGPVPVGVEAAEAVPDRPLTLEDCTVIALQRNPQIASSQQGVVTARAGLTRARSSYYPQFSLSAVEGLTSRTSFLSLGGGTFAFGGSDRREEMDLVLRETLWQRGRGDSVAESKASLQAAELSHGATRQAMVEQVARDYYGVLAAEQLVGVAEGGVESARSHLAQVETRIKLGAAAEVDVFPVQDDLARAELDLIDARSNVRLTLARLKNTMGIPLDTQIELAESAPAEERETPDQSQAFRIAMERRPEVQGAEASVRASRSALRQARVRRGPLADLAGQYTQSYDSWEARDPSWNVLLSVSYPLFDGYATKADVISARAGLRRAEADLQRTVNQVELDVENALVELERNRERVGASQKSVAAAEARLAAAESKYRQGVGILIEVIDARAGLTRALASQVQARYDYQIALVVLERVLGRVPVPDGEEG